MEGNIYKPRYKISFLAKSKVGLYKESRLRRFFNIRGRKLVRRGLFKRYILVFNNMKWTVARRYIRPFMRRRKSVKRHYKTAFYNKQQLRDFYGKFKEEAFRNLFRAHLVGVYSRNTSFYSSLERRIDMFLFRARHLPTLYAANQYVQHQGVEYNGVLEKSPNAIVGPGTSLLFDEYYWFLFSDLLYDRIDYRYYGQKLLKKRIFHRLKKKVRTLLRFRKTRKSNRKYVYYLQLVRKTKSMNQIITPIIRFFIDKHLSEKVLNLKNNGTVLYNIGNKYSKTAALRAHIENLNKEVELIFNAQRKANQTSKRLTKKLLVLTKSRKAKTFKEKLKIRKKKKRLRRKFKRMKRRIKRKSKNRGRLRLRLRLRAKYKQEIKLQLKNRINQLKRKGRLNFFFVKNLIWGKVCKKYRKKQSFQIKVKKRKQIKAYVFKLLKSIIYIYARVAHLFVLDKEYTISTNYERLQKSIWLLRHELVKAEENYSLALNLNRREKNANTIANLKNSKLIYEETSLKLKGVLSLYNQTKAYEKSLQTKAALLKEKFSQIVELFIDDFKNKRIYKRWKSWTRIKVKQKSTQTKVRMRRSGLYYFSISTKFKRRRRRTVPRLKLVHWYTPSYIHFDFNSMETIMLHDPLPSEIYHSFKCSLAKMHAFYRSRGL